MPCIAQKCHISNICSSTYLFINISVCACIIDIRVPKPNVAYLSICCRAPQGYPSNSKIAIEQKTKQNKKNGAKAFVTLAILSSRYFGIGTILDDKI